MELAQFNETRISPVMYLLCILFSTKAENAIVISIIRFKKNPGSPMDLAVLLQGVPSQNVFFKRAKNVRKSICR